MNTTIKKIMAIGAAALMLGTTIAAASATTLADYPKPFVTAGVFDGKIVIGEKANVIDVLGATDIAASLQRDAGTPVAAASGASSVTEGFRIKATGQTFNYNEQIGDIDAGIGYTDLTTILAKGTFKESEGDTENDVTYQQKLSMNSTAGTYVIFEPNDAANEAVGTYLKFKDGEVAYTYILDFDDDVEYSNATATTINNDFEGAKIKMQGNDYTVTDAVGTAAAGLTKLTMMAGDTNKWLSQGDTLNHAGHAISITSVNEDGDMCGVKVDGTVQWIEVGSDADFGDLNIGVLTAIPVHAAGAGTAPDSCELTIGSTEVILETGEEVSVGGETIDGSLVTFTHTSAGFLDKISIAYAADDDTYIAKGGSFVEPTLGNFKFMFDGVVVGNTDTIALSSGGDTGSIILKNVNGKELTFPLVGDETASGDVSFGSKLAADYSPAITVVPETAGTSEGDFITDDGGSCTTTVTVENCEGVKFLAVSAGGEARILKLKSFDTTDNKVDIEFVELNGATSAGKAYTEDTATAIDLGFMTISLTVSDTGTFSVGFTDINAYVPTSDVPTYIASGYPTFKTENGAQVALLQYDDGANATTSRFYIANIDGTDLVNTTAYAAKFALDVDGDMVIDEGSSTYLDWYAETDGSDTKLALDNANWGTIFKYDSEDKNDLTVTYNAEEADAQVFLTPLTAEISTSGGTSGVALNPIAVGMAIMDKDATLGSKPYIVVGGPCANTVAAALMSNPVDCAAGFAEGKAKIKLYSTQNALLVAGYSGLDTQGASRVLANYKDYASKFTGTELEIVTANLNSLSVNNIQ